MTTLSLHSVDVVHPPDVRALSDFSVEVAAGSLAVLVGPSGCGKTTVLRVIAGLARPDAGDVCFAGQSVLHVPPERRGAAMVFQNHELFPFRTVTENVEFGLRARRVPKKERPARVTEALAAVQMQAYASRWPDELSGGQRQRVALARALVVQPDVLLLDEPLSSLDPELRGQLRDTICGVQRRFGITTVLVTHDHIEARAMADQVVVLGEGSVVRSGLANDVLGPM